MMAIFALRQTSSSHSFVSPAAQHSSSKCVSRLPTAKLRLLPADWRERKPSTSARVPSPSPHPPCPSVIHSTPSFGPFLTTLPLPLSQSSTKPLLALARRLREGQSRATFAQSTNRWNRCGCVSPTPIPTLLSASPSISPHCWTLQAFPSIPFLLSCPPTLLGTFLIILHQLLLLHHQQHHLLFVNYQHLSTVYDKKSFANTPFPSIQSMILLRAIC